MKTQILLCVLFVVANVACGDGARYCMLQNYEDCIDGQIMAVFEDFIESDEDAIAVIESEGLKIVCFVRHHPPKAAIVSTLIGEECEMTWKLMDNPSIDYSFLMCSIGPR